MIDEGALLEIMDQADAVLLATVSGSAPRVRAMVNLRRKDLFPGPSACARDAGFDVYFCTSAASGKVRELRANPAAAAYFALPRLGRGVMISGVGEILESPDLKRALWDDSWRMYWPEGPSDPDCAVVKLAAATAAGWLGTEAFHLDLRSR